MMAAPVAPAGSSKTSGPPAAPGVRAVFTIWRMLKTVSAPSPISKTKRVWSPRTTLPGCAGPAASRSASAAPRDRVRVGGDEHHAHAAGAGTGELLRLEPLAVDRRRRLDACPAAGRELARPVVVGLGRPRRSPPTVSSTA